jgi:RHS repeat-associated protein
MNANNLTWKARELQSLTVTGGPSVAFEYNSNGIRTQKTVGGSIIHDYVLDGTKIISETVTGAGNNYTLYYLYDTSGSVQGFIYNTSYYYFQKNLQGDVIRILNSSGTVVVEYTYDAWGKVLSVTGSQASTIGQYNPFRYRGYYYDTETGFYYLQSRYYDPTVGRFLNADAIIGANGGIQGYNMFAYCNNSPIVFADPFGYCSIMIREPEGEGSPFGCVVDVTCGSNFFDEYGEERIISFGMCEEYEKLMNFIAEKEGYTENKSVDLESDYSIGYGHKIQEKDPALIAVFGTANVTKLSDMEARLLLWYDICVVGMRKVDNYSLKNEYTWTANQYFALVSVAYNSSRKYKELMDNLQNGMAPLEAFLVSAEGNRADVINGIRNRRRAEAKIYLYGF